VSVAAEATVMLKVPPHILLLYLHHMLSRETDAFFSRAVLLCSSLTHLLHQVWVLPVYVTHLCTQSLDDDQSNSSKEVKFGFIYGKSFSDFAKK